MHTQYPFWRIHLPLDYLPISLLSSQGKSNTNSYMYWLLLQFQLIVAILIRLTEVYNSKRICNYIITGIVLKATTVASNGRIGSTLTKPEDRTVARYLVITFLSIYLHSMQIQTNLLVMTFIYRRFWGRGIATGLTSQSRSLWPQNNQQFNNTKAIIGAKMLILITGIQFCIITNSRVHMSFM
jgi:hypothetical protein